MKADVTITAAEMVAALRDGLEAKLGIRVNNINVINGVAGSHPFVMQFYRGMDPARMQATATLHVTAAQTINLEDA